MLADLQGPKIRIETFADGPVHLVEGAPFVLDCRADAPAGDSARVGVSYHDLPRDVHAGDVLLLDDGLVALTVLEVAGAEVRCQVLVGGKLSNRKGLNRQGGGLSVTALSDKDKADIKLAAEIGADFLAVSFVRSAEDMHEARRLLKEAGGQRGAGGQDRAGRCDPGAGRNHRRLRRGDGGAWRSGRGDRRRRVARAAEEDHPRDRAAQSRRDHGHADAAVDGAFAHSHPRRSARCRQCGDRRHGCGDAVGGNRRRRSPGQGGGSHAAHLPRCRTPVRAEGETRRRGSTGWIAAIRRSPWPP